MARGYVMCREIQLDGRCGLYLTTISEDNSAAVALLTSGRAGLPAYHFAGRYHTLAQPLSRRAGRKGTPGLHIRAARAEDLPAALAFWQSIGPQRQFFPCHD